MKDLSNKCANFMPGWFIVQALSIDMDLETGSNPGFVRKEKK